METPRKSKPSLSSVALLGALFCCVLAFVPNDYDGTFIKSYLLYVFAALLAAVFISDWMKKGSVGLSYSTPSLAMLLFWVAGCISLIAASNIRLGLEGVLHLLCYVVIFHTAMVSVNSRAFISGVLALSAITAAVALLHFVLPGGSVLNQFFSQLSKGSTLGNPSYFAGLLVGVFPVLAGQALDRSNTTLRRLISAALVIASLYLLASIGSRSAWIGFGASITAFGLFLLRSSKMRLAIVGLLAVAGMVFILLFQAEIIQKIENISALSGESTIARRMYIYEGAWRAFAASPVIGNGIGNFVVFLPKFRPPEYWMVKSEDIAPHAHNLVLEILSETGIVGLLLFSAVVVLSFMRILKGIKSANEGDRGLLIGLAAGLTGLLADSLFSMNLSTVPVAMMFWIFLGVGAGRLVDPNFKSVTFKLPAVASKMRFAPFVLVTALVGLMIPRIVGQHISGRELLAGLYLRYEGKKSEAAQTFFLSAEQHPHPPEADFYLAGALADREEYTTALKHVDEVLKEYPYYPKIRMIGALSQFSLGDTTAALRSVHEELAIENSPQVCSFAVEISRLAGRKSDEYRFLTLQLRKNGESGTKDHAADAIDRIGTLSVELHKQDSCGMLLDTLLSKFPTDAYILVSLGRAYVDVNEVEKARQCLYSVRKIGVTDEQTRAQITSLEARIDSVGR